MSFFRYICSTLGIKDRIDLENAQADIAALDQSTGNAMIDLGEVSSCAMEAIAELGGMVAELKTRMDGIKP